MTKTELLAENARLAAALAVAIKANHDALAALSAASGRAFVQSNGKRYVSVVLTRGQLESVRDVVENAVCKQHGSHDVIGEDDSAGYQRCELILDESACSNCGRLLPRIDGFIVHYDYTRDNGTEYAGDCWGLVRVGA